MTSNGREPGPGGQSLPCGERQELQPGVDLVDHPHHGLAVGFGRGDMESGAFEQVGVATGTGGASATQTIQPPSVVSSAGSRSVVAVKPHPWLPGVVARLVRHAPLIAAEILRSGGVLEVRAVRQEP
jgi:hypothetical protein